MYWLFNYGFSKVGLVLTRNIGVLQFQLKNWKNLNVSAFISLVVDLFGFNSQCKLLILKAVHASIRPFLSLFKHFFRDPFHPPDIHDI